MAALVRSSRCSAACSPSVFGRGLGRICFTPRYAPLAQHALSRSKQSQSCAAQQSQQYASAATGRRRIDAVSSNGRRPAVLFHPEFSQMRRCLQQARYTSKQSTNSNEITRTNAPTKANELAAEQQSPQDKVTPLKQSLNAVQEQAKTVLNTARSAVSSRRPRENIYNLPNLLTVSRLIAAPLTAYLLVHDHHKWALAVFAYAGITDLVDGWLARRWKLQTVAGSVIDPMADKALMIILTVTMAVKGALPAYLATLILGRDASLALAAIYYRYASLPAPKTMTRYWDFSLPSAEVHPTTVSKYNTFLQLILIGSTLALPVVTADNHHLGVLADLNLDWLDLHQAMLYLQVLVAGTTAWSGLSYAVLKDAVTILGPDEALKAKQGARGRAIIGVTFGGVVLAAAILALLPSEDKESKSEDEKA